VREDAVGRLLAAEGEVPAIPEALGWLAARETGESQASGAAIWHPGTRRN
jgi:hypothetical protein